MISVTPVIYATRDWLWLEDVRSDLGLPSYAVRIFEGAPVSRRFVLLTLQDAFTLEEALSLSVNETPTDKKLTHRRPFIIFATVGGGSILPHSH